MKGEDTQNNFLVTAGPLCNLFVIALFCLLESEPSLASKLPLPFGITAACHCSWLQLKKIIVEGGLITNRK